MATAVKTYHISYYLNGYFEEVKGIDVLATSKYNAYIKATYEAIPEADGRLPYAVKVDSVTYANGNYREFNTIFGAPV